MESISSVPVIPEIMLQELNRLNEAFPLSKLRSQQQQMENLGFEHIYVNAVIERNTYKEGEVQSLLKRGLTASDKPYQDVVLILNMREAYTKLLRQTKPITEEFIKEVHNLLTRYVSDLEPPMPLTDYEIPIQEEREGALSYIVKSYDNLQCPFTRAIYLHNSLAHLDYFEEKNRLTARFVQMYSLLIDGKLPLLFVTPNHRLGYLESTIEFEDFGNHDPYIEWFFKMYSDMVERINPSPFSIIR